ncbi:MAG TPA: MFS transporter, partial [Ktedonobacterales bacterium]
MARTAPEAIPAIGAARLDRRLRGWRGALVCGAIIFVGFNLRSVILAVPPILPLIQHDLGLSYTEAGLLTSLPVLLMGGAAWAAGWLIGRLGGRSVVALGLALLASGGLLRAAVPQLVPLYLFTIVLSLGIALAQTSVPVLARQWFPRQIGLVSALFTDGLIIGESVGASATVPLVLGALGPDAWAGSFIFWSLPVVVGLLCWLVLTPRAQPRRVPAPTSRQAASPAKSPATGAAPVRGRVSAWHLGLLLGAGSLVYFGMNAWIPDYNLALGEASATPLALGVLNAAQLPISLAMTFVAQRLAGRRWPFITAGVLALAGVLGWVIGPVALQPLWAIFFGGSAAAVFVLGFALPA